MCAGTSVLGSDEGRTADLATIATVLCAGSGCAGFLRRASSASSCIDFQTVCSWKVVLSLVHPGSAMAPLGMDIFSLVADAAVRIRASEARALVLCRAGSGRDGRRRIPRSGEHETYPIAAASTTIHGRSEQKPLRATSGRKPTSNTTTDVHAQPQWSAITSDHSPPSHTTPACITREPTDNGEHDQQGVPGVPRAPNSALRRAQCLPRMGGGCVASRGCAAREAVHARGTRAQRENALRGP